MSIRSLFEPNNYLLYTNELVVTNVNVMGDMDISGDVLIDNITASTVTTTGDVIIGGAGRVVGRLTTGTVIPINTTCNLGEIGTPFLAGFTKALTFVNPAVANQVALNSHSILSSSVPLLNGGGTSVADGFIYKACVIGSIVSLTFRIISTGITSSVGNWLRANLPSYLKPTTGTAIHGQMDISIGGVRTTVAFAVGYDGGGDCVIQIAQDLIGTHFASAVAILPVGYNNLGGSGDVYTQISYDLDAPV